MFVCVCLHTCFVGGCVCGGWCSSSARRHASLPWLLSYAPRISHRFPSNTVSSCFHLFFAHDDSCVPLPAPPPPHYAACLSPSAGDGSSQAETLSHEWVRLDTDDYPGAGPEGVSSDGQIDPLLAFAYDAVFVAASAVQAAQEAVTLTGGGNLTGIALDRCVCVCMCVHFVYLREKRWVSALGTWGGKEGPGAVGGRRMYVLESCTFDLWYIVALSVGAEMANTRTHSPIFILVLSRCPSAWASTPRSPAPFLSLRVVCAYHLRCRCRYRDCSADRSCPFPANGSWADGAVMRDAVLSASATLVGATGPLSMSVGEDDDGRDIDTVTFCAVNLKPHTSEGARFEVISTLDGGSLQGEDVEGFQVRRVLRGDGGDAFGGGGGVLGCVGWSGIGILLF